MQTLNNHTPGPWYATNSGNHQGLIISEVTGANVAVSYDKKDAALIATAPFMYQILSEIYEDDKCGGNCKNIPHGILLDIREAIHKVRGDL